MFDIIGPKIRKTLDGIYLGAGYLAALFLVVILILILLQMLARWTGEMFTGGPDYAGYFMAGASFFAFAYALNNGNHIRVTLILGALGKYRRIGEIWCFAMATILAVYWARYAIKITYWSYKLNDVSQGQDATPIWIPQLSMAIGSVIFAIALCDNLVRVVLFGTHSAGAQALDKEE